MRHFELTDTVGIWEGRTLHQIRALVDLVDMGVAKGTYGGWVESEDNLTGRAWVFGGEGDLHGDLGGGKVYGKAVVGGQARVSELAVVCGQARVEDGAVVRGRAMVKDQASITGAAVVTDNAVVSGHARVCDETRIDQSATIWGDAVVSGMALVSGKAQVYDNARLMDRVRVEGMAAVHADAVVKDGGHVSGTANIAGTALIHGKGNVGGYVDMFHDEDISARDDCIAVGPIGRIGLHFQFSKTRSGNLVSIPSCDIYVPLDRWDTLLEELREEFVDDPEELSRWVEELVPLYQLAVIRSRNW